MLFFSGLALGLCAAQAMAQPLGTASTDADIPDATVCIPECRIGSAARDRDAGIAPPDPRYIAETAEFELDIGPTTAQPTTTADYNWLSGTPVAFTVVADEEGAITFNVGGKQLAYTQDKWGGGDVYVRQRASNATFTVTITELAITNHRTQQSVPLTGQQFTISGGTRVTYFNTNSLHAGWTMTGKITFAWEGNPLPKRSEMAVQFKIMPRLDLLADTNRDGEIGEDDQDGKAAWTKPAVPYSTPTTTLTECWTVAQRGSAPTRLRLTTMVEPIRKPLRRSCV